MGGDQRESVRNLDLDDDVALHVGRGRREELAQLARQLALLLDLLPRV